MTTIPPILQQLLPKPLPKIWQQQQQAPTLSESADYLDAASDRDVYQTDSLVRRMHTKEHTLKDIVALKTGIPAKEICLTNRVEEARALLLRLFGRGGTDHVSGFEPMHRDWVWGCAQQQLTLNALPLSHHMELPLSTWKEQQTLDTRILILEHPNLTTGVPLRPFDVADMAAQFEGLVILDESAIACCERESLQHIRETCHNVVVIQRFFGTVGMILAHPDLVSILETFKAPVWDALAEMGIVASGQANFPVQQTIQEREQLKAKLERLPHVLRVFDSATNTLLIELEEADRSIAYLREAEYILLHRVPPMEGLDQGVRLTVGTPLDNLRLIKALERLPQALSKRYQFWQNVSNGLRRASAFLGAFKKILGGGV